MTTFRFRFSDNAEIEIQGHAEYDPGHDIVCAACSMLTCMLINLEDVISEQIMPGQVKLVIRSTSYSKPVIDSIYGGFCLLADKYPDNVRELI